MLGAVSLGFDAMSFDATAFRRVGTGHDHRLVLFVVYLAGVSMAIGNGVVLFLNRVRRARFVLSLALMCAATASMPSVARFFREGGPWPADPSGTRRGRMCA